jgi:hypothetical protein
MDVMALARLEWERSAQKMEEANVQVRRSMGQAWRELEDAQAEWGQLQTAIVEMEKDGLLKANEPVNIQWKGERLFINGKKQTKQVSEKYRGLINPGRIQKNWKAENGYQ